MWKLGASQQSFLFSKWLGWGRTVKHKRRLRWHTTIMRVVTITMTSKSIPINATSSSFGDIDRGMQRYLIIRTVLLLAPIPGHLKLDKPRRIKSRSTTWPKMAPYFGHNGLRWLRFGQNGPKMAATTTTTTTTTNTTADVALHLQSNRGRSLKL